MITNPVCYRWHSNSTGVVSRSLCLLLFYRTLLFYGIHGFSWVLPTKNAASIRQESTLYSFRDVNVDCTNNFNSQNRRVIVVGKIIIDQYGDPSKRSKDDAMRFTVGGGGPQAAWGAAAALACRDYFFLKDESSINIDSLLPPKQPVTFIAPIGLQNWTPQHAAALESVLLPALDIPPILIESENHITPTINIWHDENEIQKWHPVDGSFDAMGADGLWRNRPSATDLLSVIQSYHSRSDRNENIILHSILESGSKPTGGGEDSLFLNNQDLVSKTDVLGIEPIVFPDDDTHKVSDEDGKRVNGLILRAKKSLVKDGERNKLLVVTPDRACFDSAFANDTIEHCDTSMEIIVRDGANGSFRKQQQIPSARLQTFNNQPINPTGAGNAYSAAYVACRGTGMEAIEAAVLATAVGAVVCEYEHLPEWSWDVLQRIAEAAKEVDAKLNH